MAIEPASGLEPREPLALRSVQKLQALLSLSILAMAALTLAIGVQVSDHDEWLIRMYHANWRKTDKWFFEIPGKYADIFPSPSERLLCRDLPRMDVSNGGVFVLGSSVTRCSLDPLDSLAAQRSRIFNFCQYQQTFTQEGQFLRYLVDEEGLLASGNAKVGVIIGLNFSDMAHYKAINHPAWTNCYTRDGLYRFEGNEVRRTPMPTWWRDLRLLQVRDDYFWKWSLGKVTNLATWKFQITHHLGEEPVEPQPVQLIADELGPDWQQGMDLEMAQFEQLLDYLGQHGIAFDLVYMPVKTWTRDCPPAQRYRARVMEILQRRGLACTDLSQAVPDADFGDYQHMNYRGVQTTSPIMLGLARKMLHDLGMDDAAAGGR